MAQQENSSETNSSFAHKKKFLQEITLVRNPLVFSKTLPFISGLIISYKFVDVAVVFIITDYLIYLFGTDNEENGKDINRIAAVVTYLQDGLSSIIFVFVAQISEKYTGCFNMIIYCAPVSILIQASNGTSDYVRKFDPRFEAAMIEAIMLVRSVKKKQIDHLHASHVHTYKFNYN